MQCELVAIQATDYRRRLEESSELDKYLHITEAEIFLSLVLMLHFTLPKPQVLLLLSSQLFHL